MYANPRRSCFKQITETTAQTLRPAALPRRAKSDQTGLGSHVVRNLKSFPYRMSHNCNMFLAV